MIADGLHQLHIFFQGMPFTRKERQLLFNEIIETLCLRILKRIIAKSDFVKGIVVKRFQLQLVHNTCIGKYTVEGMPFAQATYVVDATIEYFFVQGESLQAATYLFVLLEYTDLFALLCQ